MRLETCEDETCDNLSTMATVHLHMISQHTKMIRMNLAVRYDGAKMRKNEIQQQQQQQQPYNLTTLQPYNLTTFIYNLTTLQRESMTSACVCVCVFVCVCVHPLEFTNVEVRVLSK